MSAEISVQVGLAAFGLAAVWMSMVSKNPKFNRWAPVVGLAGQPFWLWATVSSGQFGMVLVCLCYTALYGRGAWKALRDNRH